MSFSHCSESPGGVVMCKRGAMDYAEDSPQRVYTEAGLFMVSECFAHSSTMRGKNFLLGSDGCIMWAFFSLTPLNRVE